LKLANYIYANGKTADGTDLGAGIVIHTNNPLVFGRVILYDNFYAMSKALKDKPPLAYAALPGYSIAIIFGGVLGMDGRIRMTSEDDLRVIQAIINAMAGFYMQNKITPHLGRFKRYLII
jgi:hypothetical protein